MVLLIFYIYNEILRNKWYNVIVRIGVIENEG